MITGKVERGRLAIGAKVEIVGRRGEDEGPFEAVVTGIQEFHSSVPEALAGHNVGLLLRGVGRDEVERGMAAIAPGSLRAHAAGEAEIVLLRADEGGRRSEIGSGYEPVLFFGATRVTAKLAFEGTLAPGARGAVSVVLDRPVAMEAGMRFAMREGGKTIGAGVVTHVT